MTNEELGPFVTCDSPVCLDWIEPPKIRTPLNRRPGFDLKNSQVYFPISQKLALIGEFDADDATYHASPYTLALVRRLAALCFKMSADAGGLSAKKYQG